MPAILRLAVVNVVGCSTSVSKSSRRLQPVALGHSAADALPRLPIIDNGSRDRPIDRALF